MYPTTMILTKKIEEILKLDLKFEIELHKNKILSLRMGIEKEI